MGRWQVCAAAAAFGASFFALMGRDAFDPGSLSGTRVLLTGASKGIGEQLAYQYSGFGADLVITAQRGDALQKVADKCLELGAKNVRSIAADMADPRNPKRVVQFALEKLGGLDYLVLNHIGATPFQMWDRDSEHTRWLMQVNFLSFVELAGAALPLLTKSNGSIVVVSSLCGKIATPFTASYSATKFALGGFFTSLRHELAMQRKHVSVTLCFLGLIDTQSTLEKIQGILSMQPYPASDSALAIIKGGMTRAREIYFPWWVDLVSKLHDWFPEASDQMIRNAYNYSG
ncbi:hydroxysteroid 11-beta-dehydrogenase 1-like protein [Callorhinchus milii]|uniref:Hydroxysteroid 11-beta-dehydrogenase 1-like protein n=1 Tax=Callorhinchus milii TaxID=7868 RepID=V9KUG4_CALMI|nr:hydroxysteroid 11-beta-dehydrogenase 1-like protein [Callorhinchus milii]